MHDADGAADIGTGYELGSVGQGDSLGVHKAGWLVVSHVVTTTLLGSLHGSLTSASARQRVTHVNGVNNPSKVVSEDRLLLALGRLFANAGRLAVPRTCLTYNLCEGYLSLVLSAQLLKAELPAHEMAFLIKSSTAWSVSVTRSTAFFLVAKSAFFQRAAAPSRMSLEACSRQTPTLIEAGNFCVPAPQRCTQTRESRRKAPGRWAW